MKGMSTPLKASRIPTLVCVNAPALITMASIFPRAACMRSIMAPSWFDWNASMVMERDLACSRADDSTSASVVDPYSAGSRVPEESCQMLPGVRLIRCNSPRRFRLGPLMSSIDRAIAGGIGWSYLLGAIGSSAILNGHLTAKWFNTGTAKASSRVGFRRRGRGHHLV